jgi:hypothetical protein
MFFVRGKASRDKQDFALDLVDDPALPDFLDVERLAEPEVFSRWHFPHFFYVPDKFRLLYPAHLEERFSCMFRVPDVHVITS